MADKAELAAAVLREAVAEEENSAKGSTEGAAAALARASRPARWGLERPAAAAPEIVERARDAAFEETWLLQRARAGTKWTRRVPHPVLSGHAATLTPY
jgi:hypothetical protein